MEAAVAGGELRCSIKGDNPILDSPSLFLNVSNRHYVVMRAKYNGQSTQGRLLLRSGVAPSPEPQNNPITAYWEGRLQTVPVVGTTDAASSLHTADMLFDDDPYTYYVSNTTKLTSVVMDLRSFRWIVGLRILPYGGNKSPRRCLLMYSTTTGIGPFKTALSFTVQANNQSADNQTPSMAASLATQHFTGFQGYARYWKLMVLDNYGGNQVAIREVYLEGYDERVTMVPFEVDNSASFHMYYFPIHTYFSGQLLKMRFTLLPPDSTSSSSVAVATSSANWDIDYIHVVRAPIFWKVRGCLDKYFDSPSYQTPMYNVTRHVHFINDHLPIYSFTKQNLTDQYATTYDCPLSGKDTSSDTPTDVLISIEGENLGANPRVYVGGRTCPIVQNLYNEDTGRIQELLCRLPASDKPGPTVVRIENGQHPQLFFELPALSYRVAPSVPKPPTITNFAARKVDLVWEAPGDAFMQMTVTGYKLIWFQPTHPSFVSNITVGNITTTSIRGLQPGTEYVFAVAAIAEGHDKAALPTDLYGRRDHFSLEDGTGDGLLGGFSDYTNVTGTLENDFKFQFFNSNQSLNNSYQSRNSDGPTGLYGSEGGYGLVFVGAANLANCNSSSTCCDGYNATLGAELSCARGYASVCAVLLANSLAYDYVINGGSRRGVPSTLAYDNGASAVITFITLDELITNKGASLPDQACGPQARLTPSQARSSGAMWYARKMNVYEGFDMKATFQISNPSLKCDRMDDVNTFCRSRGADGFAFVIQNVAPNALGNAGSGLGYEGIFNSLAVELDTYHNYDQMDYYENHVAVLTQGFRNNISANHSYSLATSNKVPDLTDGIHTIRIRYSPNFNPDDTNHPSFQTTGYTTWFLNNADFENGGVGDWGTGFGLLYVYIDDLYSPVITTPLNLGATLSLDDGRAYVGFTAATGNNHWQAHDVLSWTWDSLFEDIAYTYDNIEGWMSGTDGFCEYC
eukprot:gene10559-7511_t